MYNTAITETTEVSSFFANYKFNINTNELRGLASIAQKASIQVEQLTSLHKQLQHNIHFYSERSAIYHNKKRDRGSTLKEEDKVYLLQRNIKTKQLNSKLNHVKLKPFQIVKTKGSVTLHHGLGLGWVLTILTQPSLGWVFFGLGQNGLGLGWVWVGFGLGLTQ